MLENNFNELDIDFITVWATFLTTQKDKYTEIKENLEKLAELGQVNAIQSYYLFMKDGDKSNEFIDENVDKLGNDSFNNLLAKAHKQMFIEGFEGVKNSRHHYLRKQKNLQSYKILQKAKAMCLDEYADTKNILCLLRFGEIATTKSEISLFHNLCKKENDSLQYSIYPNQIFAIAKYLYFFGDKTQKQIGFESLQDLANRPLSETLRNYNLKVKTINKWSIEEEKAKNREDFLEQVSTIKLWELAYTGQNVHTKKIEEQEAEGFKKYLSSKTYEILSKFMDENGQGNNNSMPPQPGDGQN